MVHREGNFDFAPFPDAELYRCGYSIGLPENERWFILREAAEEMGYSMVINNINFMIAKGRRKKPIDNVKF